MSKFLNAIKIFLYQQPLYSRYYKNLSIEKNVVLLESTHGKAFGGHLFYLAKELNKHYSHLKLYVASENVDQTRKFLDRHGLHEVHLVKYLSRDYLKLLASAAYLLNDTSFYSFFIKKAGQHYVNFWHGTPLKTLGQDMENITDGANVQRNFYMTDQIIVSNDFLADVLAKSHGLNGIFQGKMVVAPSPRNAVLFDNKRREMVREELGVNSKNVSFYVPTWRGSVGCIDNDQDRLRADLRYLSENLTGDEMLYVKLHPFSQAIDLDEFEHVFVMPDGYELYEFLTAVDVLITDYSSVMYDFALTNRKVILYNYDKDDYVASRGVYEDVNDYPFVQVDHVGDLLVELQKLEAVDYEQMVARFCSVDTADGARIVCDYIFDEQGHELIKTCRLCNEKETAIVLGGAFWDNGVTTSLLNTFDHIDLSARNYVVLLGQKQLKKDYEFRVRGLADEITFYPFPETLTAGVVDRFLYLAYMRFEWFDSKWVRQRIGKLVRNDYKRIFGDLKVDHLVHFTGFGNRYAELIKHAPCGVNTVMYVHTDMPAEYKAKKNFSKKIIYSAYEAVDKVAVVHENLRAGLIQELPAIQNKLCVMNNFLGEERIRALARADLYTSLEDVEMLHGKKVDMTIYLKSKDMTVFTNIGRFDYQKGHERLIQAFEAIYEKNSATRLVIVAPHGPLRDATLEQARKSSACYAIYILGRMSNPYALLSKSSCFVLSSHYEGLGLVVYEALAVGTAVVTVDLEETIGYLQNNEAIIVNNSMEGLKEGMETYLTGYPVNAFDFSVPKEMSKREFEQLFVKK